MKDQKTKTYNVLTYGTFDLFHLGHRRILKRAYKLSNGGKVFVGVSSDDWNQVKGKDAFQSESERVSKIKELKFIEKVFLEDHSKPGEQWEGDYKKYKIDFIVMGNDRKELLEEIFKDSKIKIFFLKRTPFISSSLKKKIYFLDRKE